MNKRIYHLKCKNCGEKFTSFTTRAMWCNNCKTVKINCDNCHKEYEINRQYINKNHHFCSNLCQLNYVHNKRSGPGECIKCGKFNKRRNSAGIGIYCGCINKHLLNNDKDTQKARSIKSIQINTSSGNCSLCGKFNKNRNIYGVGINCGCHSLKQKEHLKNNTSSGNCTICGKYVSIRDTFGRCEDCSSIYTRDKNKRIIKIGNTSWNDYIKHFQLQKSPDFKELGFKRINFDESELHKNYPTLAWEQRFADVCKFPWVVYIKYYVGKEGRSKPIVVGKTGTQNINKSGTDICFDYDYDKNNKRAARQFLEENNLYWNKSYIDFKCFKTEKEAYKYERKIQNKYKLFGG